MTETASLVLAADSRQIRAADKDLAHLEQTGKRTERATDQLSASFRRLAGPLAAFLSARQILQSAEAWTTINNRLRLVTDSTAELIAAQQAVFDIAQESRQPLEATAELYQRIATNQDALGLSGAGVVAIVDTINKSLAISGASGASAGFALVQLGQAFASGVLRGEELNSVLEQAPALSQAIAKGMNVTVGDLKKLGEQGVLTAQNVVDALLSQGDAVDKQFSTIKSTVSQAFVTLGNSLTRTVGQLDEATGATSSLSGEMIDLSKWIDSGQLADGLLEVLSLWRQSFATTELELGLLGQAFESFGDKSVSDITTIGSALKELPINVTAMVKILTVEVAALFDKTLSSARAFREGLAAIFTDDTIADAAKREQDRLGAIDQARRDSIQTILDERQAILSTASAEQKAREDARAARDKDRIAREAEIATLRGSKTGGAKPGAGGAKPADKAAKEAERASKTLQDSFANMQESLSQQVALYGSVSEAARVRYDTENGDLAGLNDLQKQRLVGLAEELDALHKHADFAKEVQSILSSAMPAAQQEVQQLTADVATLKTALQEAAAAGRDTSAIEEGIKNLEKLMQEAYQRELDSLYEGLLTEEEYIRQSYDRRKELILASTEATETEKADLMRRLEEEKTKAIQKFEQDKLDERLGMTSYYLGAAATLMQSGNAKLFAIGKAAAIAEATVSGYQAAAKALAEVPYPFNIAAAVAVGAAAAVQVANIAATEYSGAYDMGGDIPAGKWGIAGEKGPEVIYGPASVVSRKDTAAMLKEGSSAAQQQQPVNIRNINLFDGQVIEDHMGSDKMAKVNINHVRRNRGAYRAALGL